MIDIWLLFGLLMLFMVFLILVIVDATRIKENEVLPFSKEAKSKKVKPEQIVRWAQIVMPVITALFCSLYWTFALTA